MRTRTASLIASAALVTGFGGAVAVTPAEAASSDNPVASRLAGIKNALSGLVSDGTLTQEQADQVAETLDSELTERGFGHPGGPGGRSGGLEAAAEVLGLTSEQLSTELRDGKTLAEVAQAQDVSVDNLVDGLVADAEERIDAAVQDGRLTATQADELRASLTDRIAERVNSTRPAGGRGRHGPHGGLNRPNPPVSPDESNENKGDTSSSSSTT